MLDGGSSSKLFSDVFVPLHMLFLSLGVFFNTM